MRIMLACSANASTEWAELTFDVNRSRPGDGDPSGVLGLAVKLHTAVHTWRGRGRQTNQSAHSTESANQ